MEKIYSSEEINNNLSKIIVHLEEELSNYKGDVDVSGEVQKGSAIESDNRGRED